MESSMPIFGRAEKKHNGEALDGYGTSSTDLLLRPAREN